MSDTWKNSALHVAHDSMCDTVDQLEGLIEWAEEEGYTAIQHKLEETLGPLSSAMVAALQYDDGTLERR